MDSDKVNIPPMNMNMGDNSGGAEGGDEESFPIYMIIPSGKSYFFSVIIALVVYFIYLVMIGYMTSYNAKFVPNYAMLWDFMVGMNTTNYQNEFVQYLENVLAYASINLNNDSNQVGEGGFWKNGKWFSTKDSFVGSNLEKNSSSSTSLHGLGVQSMNLEGWGLFGQKMWSKLQMMWNQAMIQAFVQGKKVKVSRI